MTKYLRTTDGRVFRVSDAVSIVWFQDTIVTDAEAVTIATSAASAGVTLLVSSTPTDVVPDPAPTTTLDTGIAALVRDVASKTHAAILEMVGQGVGGGYDVFVFWGQSNMVGYGSPIDPAIDVIDARIFEFAQSGDQLGEIIPANDPMHAEQGQIGVGHAVALMRTYAATLTNPDRKVLGINGAHGATHFSNPNSANGTWDPNAVGTGKNLAQALVAAANTVLAGPGNQLIAIVGHQGEGSATAGNSQAVYEGYHDELEDYFRANITGAATVPMVLGGMMPEGVAISAAKQEIRRAHLNIPARRERTAYWDGVPGHVSGTSPDHYDAPGQRLIGQTVAWDAFQRAQTNVTGTAPTTPGSITIATTSSTATATWTPGGGRVTGYDVEASVNGAAFVAIPHTTVPMELTSQRTGLASGNTVAFRVRAKGPTANSPYRTSSTVTVAAVPTQVTGVTVGTVTATTVALSWTAIAGATSYVVEQSPTGANTWAQAATPTTNGATITGLSPATGYDYRVAAVNAAGQGPYSATTGPVNTAAPAPLLDEVGVAAFFAHALVKLRAAYTGPAIRVRNGVGAFADIGFTGNNLNTAALTAHCGSGDGWIETWYDQTGNNRHRVQTNTIYQTKLVTAGVVNTLNGQPFTRYAPQAHFLDTHIGLWAAGAASALSVVQSTGAVAQHSALIGEVGSTNTPIYGLLDHSTNKVLVFLRSDANTVMANSGQFGGVLTTEPHVATAVDTGAQITARVDGTLNSTLNYTRTGNTITVTQRASGRFGSGFLDAHVACDIGWAVALTDTQRSVAEASAAAIWGTP